jgi:hypothetical protein
LKLSVGVELGFSKATGIFKRQEWGEGEEWPNGYKLFKLASERWELVAVELPNGRQKVSEFNEC